MRLETVTQHQSGTRGIIRLFRAVTETGHATPFVTHISRFPRNDDRCTYLYQEFYNLQSLAALFAQNLSEETRQHYNVVSPIKLGMTGPIGGQEYPFFTMPYVPRGELHQHWKPYFEDQSYAVPYFLYAMPYTDAKRKLIWDQTGNAVSKSGIETHERLSRNLLIAHALIYHLTNGKILKDHLINAGDWMADIRPEEGMDLTLISVQNGFTQLLNDKEWIEAMKNHQEPCEVPIPDQVRSNISVHTFLNRPDKFFYQCLNEAAKLIKY